MKGSQYNARWLVRTVEYSRPKDGLADLEALSWCDIIGPLPSDFERKCSPGHLAAIAQQTGTSVALFQIKPSLLKVLGCFCKTTIRRIASEGHDIESVVAKSRMHTPQRYRKPDVLLLGPPRKRLKKSAA
jgi:hypothetical protein